MQEASDHELSTGEAGGAPQEVTLLLARQFPQGIPCHPPWSFLSRDQEGGMGWLDSAWGPYSLLLLVSEGSWSVRGPM